MAAQLLQAAEILDARAPSPSGEFDLMVPCMDERYTDQVPFSSADTESGNDSEMDDETSSSPIQSAQGRNKPYKRQGPRDPLAHNTVEKRRRAYLADCYSRLKDAIPSMRQTKTSNALILQGAADYVLALQADEARIMAELNHQQEIKQSRLATRSKRAKRHAHYFVPAREEAMDNERLVPALTPASAVRHMDTVEDGFQTAPGSPIHGVEEQSSLGLMLLAQLLEGCKYQSGYVATALPRPQNIFC